MSYPEKREAFKAKILEAIPGLREVESPDSPSDTFIVEKDGFQVVTEFQDDKYGMGAGVGNNLSLVTLPCYLGIYKFIQYETFYSNVSTGEPPLDKVVDGINRRLANKKMDAAVEAKHREQWDQDLQVKNRVLGSYKGPIDVDVDEGKVTLTLEKLTEEESKVVLTALATFRGEKA